MFEHMTIQSLDDFFLDLDRRPGRGIYFYRISGYDETVRGFIEKYYEAARRFGVVIEGKIPNPTEANLAYYEEAMGTAFQMDPGFITAALLRWLPRLDGSQREAISQALFGTLGEMRAQGKNDYMLKNAYTKFMCWLYYRFERILIQLGRQRVPKILYEGEVSNYELGMFSVLSCAGCDVVLLQYKGDQGYLRLDPQSRKSHSLELEGLGAFPASFCLRQLGRRREEQDKKERMYGPEPEFRNCTNAWTQGRGLEDCRTAPAQRGQDAGLYYNCFYRIFGVEDKLTYLNELYQFQLGLREAGRKAVLLEHSLPQPDADEIAAVPRRPYEDKEALVADLSRQIIWAGDSRLQRVMQRAFIDLLLEEAKAPQMSVNRLLNRAVCLVCWFRRYQAELFAGWKMPQVACLVYLGGCKNEKEALFLRYLARLPVDVLILCPDTSDACCLRDPLLCEVHYENFLKVPQFPREGAGLQMGTAAYHAERELDELMYQDSGMYRNQQYQKAVSVVLRTTYEEIAILWDQELKYRPNFSVVDSVVNVPVLFAKVSGVKDGLVPQYWASIRELVTEDTYVVRQAPFVDPRGENPLKAHAAGFLRGGRLLRDKIRSHPAYRYGFLREEVQDHILDKLQLLIDRRMIRGIRENGTEYTAVATVLNMNMDLVRLIQRFDFTRRNPKLVYIHTGEGAVSLEDSILTAFLSLAGFDVVFFVPTGYQGAERYYLGAALEEHQIGEYKFDLRVPEFSASAAGVHRTWRDLFNFPRRREH